MSDPTPASTMSRRELFGAALAAPLGLHALAFGSDEPAPKPLLQPAPPPYTLSINIEIMFPNTMSKPDRIRAVAANGFKAYSFWNSNNVEERAQMIRAQEETGLTCVSMVGTGNAGGTTGFSMPGQADVLLGQIRERVAIAKQFGSPDLISFVGRYQEEVPWEAQRASIVEGLKRAGDIVAEAGLFFTYEPLSVDGNQPRRALDRTLETYPVIQEVNHPNVKVCFDVYHLQRTEGNIVVNLRRGFEQNLIKVVQIGDVPGRLEPGTGEINYPFIFAELRRLNYTGYLDTEMGTSSTPEHAMNVAREMSMQY